MASAVAERRKAGAPLIESRAAAQAAIGETMRLSALRLPSFCLLVFLRFLVVSKARARKASRECFSLSAPAKRGRGTARRVVEGACGGGAGVPADAPPAALRAVPPPRYAGRDKWLVIASISEAIHGRLRGKLDCFVAAAPRNDESPKCAGHNFVIRALPVFLICWVNWHEA